MEAIALPLYEINNLREFPLSPDETNSWSEMIIRTVPKVNPIEVEEAILDLAKGKYDYNKSQGVRSIILAIQGNRGDNWYYDPNK